MLFKCRIQFYDYLKCECHVGKLAKTLEDNLLNANALLIDYGLKKSVMIQEKFLKIIEMTTIVSNFKYPNVFCHI